MGLAYSSAVTPDRSGAIETPATECAQSKSRRVAPGDSTASGHTFDPFRVRLDHVALACADLSELHRVASALTGWGIENTGVKTDDVLGKDYVAFRDPDGIKWELYMA